MSLITVIIPVYNAEDFLADAIESVMAQTFNDWQLIVIDDGSRDTSFAIAQKYAQQDARITTYHQSNHGVAITRNRGLSYVAPDTRYVLLLDNDDYLEANALEVLYAALENAPNACAAYGLFRYVTYSRQFLTQNLHDAHGYRRYSVKGRGLARLDLDAPTTFEAMVIECYIATPGQVLIRHDVLRQAREFDQHVAPGDDWDMWLRLLLISDFIRVPQFTLNKRQHANNVSGDGRILGVAEMRVRRKMRASAELTASQRRIARRGHLYAGYVRLTWAMPPFRTRHYFESVKAVGRAARYCCRYFHLHYLSRRMPHQPAR